MTEFPFLFKSCSALGEASQLHQGQPPLALAPYTPGVSAADLFSYERSLALSKMAANPALMGQHAALRQAAMGMGAGASQAIYDGGFQSVNPQWQAQQAL